MDRNVPHDDVEEKMLQQFRHIYGNDVLAFRFTGAEVVEMMAMGYRMGIESMTGIAPKEK